MKIFRAILLCALLCAPVTAAQAQGYQCRTSPVGASTSYCASEAFVTASAGGGLTNYKQDFIAGTGFTPGFTTSLTLANPPSSQTSLLIIFDGVSQSNNTFSLAGAVVTFNAAIPSNVQVVEAVSGVVGGSSLNLTTRGSSGAATLVGNDLNIPVYAGGGGGSIYGYLVNPVQETTNCNTSGHPIDPTGVTDSSAGIAACAAIYPALGFPSGTFIACNVSLGTFSSFTIQGAGALRSGAMPAGSAAGVTVFTCNSTTQNVFTISYTGYITALMQGFSCTKSSGTMPSAGACIGYSGNPVCSPCVFRDLFAENQWNGFARPPSIATWWDNVWAWNNYNDGFLNGSDSSSNMSDSGIAVIAEFNSGYGLEFVNSGTGFGTVGNFSNGLAFANGAGGIYAHATSSGSVNDLFIDNFTLSSNNNDGVKWNAGGGFSWIGGLIEQSGTSNIGNVGRNQSIAPSGTGNGINIVAGQNIQITGASINTSGSNGIGTASGVGWINITGNFIYYNGITAGACGTNCSGIIIGGTATLASVSGNIIAPSPNQAFAIYSNSATTAATGNVASTASGNGCSFPAGAAKAGNIGTGC